MAVADGDVDCVDCRVEGVLPVLGNEKVPTGVDAIAVGECAGNSWVVGATGLVDCCEYDGSDDVIGSGIPVGACDASVPVVVSWEIVMGVEVLVVLNVLSDMVVLEVNVGGAVAADGEVLSSEMNM